MFKCFKKKHIHEKKVATTISVPTSATFKLMKIEIHSLEKFTQKEREKFYVAMMIGEKVLNSWNFKMKMISTTFFDSEGMSGKQIWELICTGADLYTKKDNDIDVFVTMYDNFWSGTVGYTFPDTFKTWFNRKFFSNFNEAEIFGNVMHEAMHNLGFNHKDYETRQNSVPYKVGYIARELARKQMKGGILTPLPRNT